MQGEYADAYAELYRTHWWWRVREEILLETIGRLLTDRGSPARILDVGCGAGLFFDALARFGDVYGIESDTAIVGQSERWRERIRVGELDASFDPEERFDLILMLDVIEHVTEPEQVLRSAARVLARGGRVLITVPAFEWLWTRHDDMNQHVTRYTAGRLDRLVSQAGLTVTHTNYLFQSLVLPKLVVRACEALIHRPASIPRTPAPTLNRFLQTWFRAEHALAARLPFGSSLMAVARRPDA